MCGRFALTATPAEVEQVFGIAGLEPFPPRYNIAPTQPIGIVRTSAVGREGALVRWGLVPHWVRDPGSFSLLVNARCETAAEKPAFRTAMRHRRCLIPASGYYEWRRGENFKQPFWIAPGNGGPIALAGLWETWMGKDGSEIDTGAFLTIGANRTLSTIHHRMPVVVNPDDYGDWLDPFADIREVSRLLRPAPEDYFRAIPVGVRVNSARNDGPDLQDPIDPGRVEGRGGGVSKDAADTGAASVADRKSAAGGQMDLF